MEYWPAVLVIAFVVIIGVAIVAWVFARRAREQRQQAFGQLAAAQGWQFVPEDDSYARRWQGKPFASRGSARNIIIGQHRGRNFCSFAYHYTTTTSTGTTTTSQSHDFAVYVIALPAPVPEFSVSPEGIFGGKVAEALGFERVNIGDEDFNNTFKVKSDNVGFGSLVLQPDLVQMLKATGPWEWRFTGQDMISFDKGVFEPAMLPPRLELMCDVLERIPNDAWQRPEPI